MNEESPPLPGDIAARLREGLWGWDPIPGIVSIWAEASGLATLWRRLPTTGELLREEARFRPWVLLDRLDDLLHLGPGLSPEGEGGARVTFRELEGTGRLRYLVRAEDGRFLTNAVLRGASARLGRELGPCVNWGRSRCSPSPRRNSTWWRVGAPTRDLAFDQLHRMQFDLETTGLSPRRTASF
ncbi:MAG: hypothetical protein U0527_15575 [Candidatus Eisenbacteria bacterium]